MRRPQERLIRNVPGHAGNRDRDLTACRFEGGFDNTVRIRRIPGPFLDGGLQAAIVPNPQAKTPTAFNDHQREVAEAQESRILGGVGPQRLALWWEAFKQEWLSRVEEDLRAAHFEIPQTVRGRWRKAHIGRSGRPGCLASLGQPVQAGQCQPAVTPMKVVDLLTAPDQELLEVRRIHGRGRTKVAAAGRRAINAVNSGRSAVGRVGAARTTRPESPPPSSAAPE